MNTMKRIAVVSGTAVLGLSVFVVACDKSAGAAAGAVGSPAGASAVGSASVDATNYKLELKPEASYAAGKEGTFQIIVKTKGEYHVNDEFPSKFKVLESANVTYAQAKIEKMKDASAFALTKCNKDSKDSCTMVLTVKFTPAKGATKVGGELSFGVCNKDSCLIEKKSLDSDIKVN